MRVERVVVLDGVAEVKDGESCTFFGAIKMAICVEMCFGNPHDGKNRKSSRRWMRRENGENTGGSSRLFIYSRKFACLALFPPLPRGLIISYYVLGSPDRWCFPRIFSAGVVAGLLGYRSNRSC